MPHHPYRRRAYLLCAFTALEAGLPLASQAVGGKDDPESLWEALTHTVPSGPLIAASTRRTLGPVPGFTVPVPASALTPAQSDFFNQKKRSRGMLGPVGEAIGRLQAATGTSINFKGSSMFSMRSESVSGGADAVSSYHSDQYFGAGSNGFYNQTQLDIDATFFKHFKYKTTINNHLLNNPGDPNFNRVQVDYNVANTRVQWGDINAGFAGNSLVSFNRFLSGVQWTNSWSKRIKTQFLYSQTKAEAKTYTLQGAGNSGPYYIFSGQIVDGSARVRLNDRELVLGKDFSLDQYTGELKLLNGLIALPSDTLAVTYEALYGYGGQSSGNIYGARLDLLPLKNISLGMTYVQQTAKGSGGSQRETRYFYGYNTPAAAYELPTPIDFTKPLEVRIAGALLVKDADYVTDTRFPTQIRILQAVPSSQQIQIDYYPIISTITPGNRSVTALDSRLSLGKLGTLTAETAISGLAVAGANQSGSAWNLRADLNPLRSLHTLITLKNIGPTYSSIESPGFGRNERGIEVTADYSVGSRLRFNGTYQSSRRAAYGASTLSQYALNSIVGEDTYGQKSLSASYQFAKNGSLSLSRTLNNTDAILGQTSNNRTDSLAMNWGIRSLTFDASLNRNVSKYAYAADVASNLYQSGLSATWSRHLGVTWNPLKWASFTSSISDNDIQSYLAGTKTLSNAKDMSLSARLSPSNSLHINLSHTLSDSGNTTPGAANGYGTGLLNGGTNLGLGSGGSYSGGLSNLNSTGYNSYTSFGGKSSGNRISLEFVPRRDMTLQLGLDQSSSVGDYLYNSSRSGYSFAFGWQPSQKLAFDVAVASSKNTLTNGFGGSDSKTLTFSLRGKPFGSKLNTTLNYQQMISKSAFNSGALTGTTGSTTLTDSSSNLSSYAARVDYPLGRKFLIFGDIQKSDTTGSFGFNENNVKFGLDYLISQTRDGAWKFSLGWQIYDRKNKDASLYNLNYRVSTLLAEFGFNFM